MPMPESIQNPLPRGRVAIFDADLVGEYEDYLNLQGYGALEANRMARAARHFLIWLDGENIALGAIDGRVLIRFFDHRCACPSPVGSPGRYKRDARPTRLVKRGVRRFIWFLEVLGRLANPGEIQLGYRLLDRFVKDRLEEGYALTYITGFRSSVRHFVFWLHLSRIPFIELSADVLERFAMHDCMCPCVNPTANRTRFSRNVVRSATQFSEFVAESGLAPNFNQVCERASPVDLIEFRNSLKDERGLADRTIGTYLPIVSKFLKILGTNPELYDAEKIRAAFSSHCRGFGPASAQRIATAVRTYLRFAVVTGRCRPGLDQAVPKGARWAKSSLPRYISADSVESVIASCNSSRPIDLRDRCILLFLARLGLRAGDVVGLRLNDLDWNKSVFRVSGKSRQISRLPLPQDVGDALLTYLEHARPRVNESRVFLRIIAPYRPLNGTSAINHIVRRALRRARVVAPAGVCSHVFRHSVATNLLRTGTSMEAIGAVLRHRAPESTELYAKVDVRMLDGIARPWIGDTP